MRPLTRLVKRATRERQRRIGSLAALAEESFSNIALVQAYNRQALEVERFHRENDGALRGIAGRVALEGFRLAVDRRVQVVSALAVVALGTLALQRRGPHGGRACSSSSRT